MAQGALICAGGTAHVLLIAGPFRRQPVNKFASVVLLRAMGCTSLVCSLHGTWYSEVGLEEANVNPAIGHTEGSVGAAAFTQAVACRFTYKG